MPVPSEGGKVFDDLRSQFDQQVAALSTALIAYCPGQSCVQDAEPNYKVYSTNEVNNLLSSTKNGMLSRIPPEDAPLRNYVEQKFPPSVAGIPSATKVESRLEQVRALFSKFGIFSTPQSFRLDLAVNTTPFKARFDLIPAVGNPITTTTNDTITNVYRGEYKYIVTKAGYKTVNDTIDFVTRAGTIFSCDLQPNNGPEQALPCKLN